MGGKGEYSPNQDGDEDENDGDDGWDGETGGG